MEAFIHSVISGALAEQSAICAGDQVLSVNGHTDLEDLFDYQYAIAGESVVTLALRHADGIEETVVLRPEDDEDLGLVFTSPIFTPIKTCNNACPFCFIDQQPPGLRSSLYVKDDDWRLSYFNNTYITLTNLTPRDRQRIEQIRPGPLYVSVHSTVPEIRQVLLKNNKQAGHILKELRWLKGLGIPFHCQMVICPGINDGPDFQQSLADLSALRPEALSVAVIPVGLTQHRDHLPQLTAVDKVVAQNIIAQVEAFKAQHPEKDDLDDFIYLSDEFYYKAGLPLPTYEAYGDFPQLDDGVGTVRMLLDDFHALASDLPAKVTPSRNVLILTGKLASMSLSPIVQRLNEIEGLYVDCLPVESHFWGEAVDVAGLITGQDIVDSLKAHDTSGYGYAVIPGIMLKEDTQLFLDGKTVDEVSQACNLPFRVVADSARAQNLLEILDLCQAV